jgi:hypothetical protein
VDEDTSGSLSLVEARVSGEPAWLQPFFRPRPGADPLGQQTITTDRIIGRLIPGVLALSERARYFSFYAWLLGRYRDQARAPTGDVLSRYMKEREYELALAVRLCPRKCGSGPIGGSHATPVYVQTLATFPRRESVESPYGGYGLYYSTPMNQMGLTARAGTLLGEEPIPIDILRPEPHARAAAEAFAAAVADTRYVREYMDSADPIPRDVLIEYSERACLCRLDEWTDERAALRRAFFVAPTPEFASDTERRREAFALYLELAGAERWTESTDDRFRAAIWPAFRRGAEPGSPRARAIGGWAALAAANYLHDGVTQLWSDAGRRLRSAAPDDGYGRDELKTHVSEFARGRFQLPAGVIEAVPEMETSDFIAAMDRFLPPDDDLPTLWRAARADGTTLAGVARVLGVLTRLPDRNALDKAWGEIANTDGEWQDGLLRQRHALDEHLDSAPSLGETTAWLVERLVLRPHEANAASKLPDFTFRFRRELGRWRFYDHDFGWIGPGNIRASTLAQLSRDLGYCEWPTDGCRLTADGAAFIEEVFI